VELRVGLGTLLGIDDQPGELPGWGTVTAQVARTIAARQRRAEWRFAIVDNEGGLLFDGITRRRPRAAHADRTHAQADGGIVELHVPLSLLDNPGLAAQYPAWASVLADLTEQHTRQERPAQDPAARFPGRPLRRHSQITFQTCLFPGCRRPATGSDEDHLRDHARGGPTAPENLAPACRHDHMNKTRRGWRVSRRDEPGSVPSGADTSSTSPPSHHPYRHPSPGHQTPTRPTPTTTWANHSCPPSGQSPNAADHSRPGPRAANPNHRLTGQNSILIRRRSEHLRADKDSAAEACPAW
jgi:hypothetical protein